MLEIHTLAELTHHLEAGRSLENVVVQSVNLSSVANQIFDVAVSNTLFLGCEMPDQIICSVVKRGASVFPSLNDRLPFNPYMPTLYSTDTLFDGFDAGDPCSYCNTTDARVYKHWQQTGGSKPATICDALGRRLHDMAMTNAIEDFLSQRADRDRIVGMMGGHSMLRSDDAYLKAAMISRELTLRGYLMVSGGGPGAMEATHVGAWFADRTHEELVDAVQMLAQAPGYQDKQWLAAAFQVREKYPLSANSPYVSLGIPTWLYGHEPPTPFATHIAKYFANSVREDGLVTLARSGLIFTPGSAGTIQEIFQDATQNYYVTTGVASPMVFMDRDYWTNEKPVYPIVRELAEGYDYHDLIAIFDEVEPVVEFIESHQPILSKTSQWSFCAAHCSEEDEA